jgi:hypothetical protein
MFILIKFPTRSRPDKFFSVLDQYIDNATDINKIGFLITLDTDDVLMNNQAVIARLQTYKNLTYKFGDSKNKIEAINNDINSVNYWDILLLASDDMVPIEKGYDDIIRDDMRKYFSDLDGVLWYNDGTQDRTNTLSILGKRYYDRFNYIYHPAYISLWCDNEFTDVSIILNKVYKTDRVIIKHVHPNNCGGEYDQLYIKNELYFNQDEETYKQRKKNKFDLT